MAEQAIHSPAARASAAPLTRAQRWHTFAQGLIFVVGFATFIIGVFGFVGTLLGDVFYDSREVVRVLGGVALIVFGLFTLRVINLPFLYSDTRRDLGTIGKGVGAARSYLTGMAFAAGWTPCIGPFLGAILTLSVTSELGARIALLTAYTLGLGVPFLMVAALADRMVPALRRVQRHMRAVEIISGILLIAVGAMLLLGQISQLSASLAGTTFELETQLLGNAALSVPVAAAAGLLSFLSPCVLPLVPAYIGFIGGVAVNDAARQRSA
ncbi:MAG: cytochrome c biogenesis protein CcdA [Anaerolineae bacterium]|nr:cytochrome c biogenesis protein CcdA [Anaerolineae bacterium]